MVDSVSLTVLDSANIQTDYYFQVNGSSLDSTESLEIYIESINSGVTLGSTFTSMSGLNVQISTSQLASLGLGPTLIKASRVSINNDIIGSPVGGVANTSYSVLDTVIIY